MQTFRERSHWRQPQVWKNEEQYPEVSIEGTYDSSGKLQSQIEAGADVDIFFSAALKQMEALQEEGYIAEDASVDLLENKIVLIVPAGNESSYTSFEDIVNADMIAIGDPESVPAGQYGKEALENLDLWSSVEGKSWNQRDRSIKLGG